MLCANELALSFNIAFAAAIEVDFAIESLDIKTREQHFSIHDRTSSSKPILRTNGYARAPN